jgi:hypothetical protein
MGEYRHIDIGKKITRRELQARWGWCEISNKRFAHDRVNFRSEKTESLYQKAKGCMAFEDLSPDEIDALLSLHEDCFRSVPRGEILECISNADEFVCENWCKEELLDTQLPPKLGGGLFVDFVIRETTPGMSNDPRTEFARRQPVDPFVPTEPICVVPHKGRQLLLEGALRALHFMTTKAPDAEIQVWVPAKAQEKAA